jgi:hypothetical protein
MEFQQSKKINRPYLLVVLAFMFVLPCLSVIAERLLSDENDPVQLIGKWFIFWSVGIRLLVAGIRQLFSPAFTAETIFHLKDTESFEIIKELGIANICFGVMGITSFFIPSWRIVSAIIGGLFFGMAGANHLIKKPASTNARIAMVSDLFISLLMTAWVFLKISRN